MIDNEKITTLNQGAYILAVSGGVDSVCLLDLLTKQYIGQSFGFEGDSSYRFIVAHFDHGIQQNSNTVAGFVAKLSDQYNLEYETGHGYLGSIASEDVARKARYEFLRKVQKKYSAKAIITAHHQDDKIETAILQTLRGTGRYGMDPFSRTRDILRPLADIPKSEILHYAIKKNLHWMDDPSNEDIKFKRNYIRNVFLPRLEKETPKFRNEFLKDIEYFAQRNKLIDEYLRLESSKLFYQDNAKHYILSRDLFIDYSEILRNALLHYIFITFFPKISINKDQIQRLSEFCVLSRTNALFPFSKHIKIQALRHVVIFTDLSQ